MHHFILTVKGDGNLLLNSIYRVQEVIIGEIFNKKEWLKENNYNKQFGTKKLKVM